MCHRKCQALIICTVFQNENCYTEKHFYNPFLSYLPCQKECQQCDTLDCLKRQLVDIYCEHIHTQRRNHGRHFRNIQKNLNLVPKPPRTSKDGNRQKRRKDEVTVLGVHGTRAMPESYKFRRLYRRRLQIYGSYVGSRTCRRPYERYF